MASYENIIEFELRVLKKKGFCVHKRDLKGKMGIYLKKVER